MKYLSAALIFTVLFCNVSAFAQKNAVRVSALYVPLIGNDMAHGSVGYYQQLAVKRSLGLKLMYGTTGIGKSADQVRFTIANLDIVHRWKLSQQSHRSCWNLEAGISTALTYLNYPPLVEWIYVDPVSEQQMLEDKKYFDEVLSKWHGERKFYAGLASSVDWQFAFTQHFGLGIGCMVDVLRSSEKEWTLLPIPNVNAGYIF